MDEKQGLDEYQYNNGPKSKKGRLLKNASSLHGSDDEDIDFMYGRKRLVVQEFHTESFDRDSTVCFAYFQSYELTSFDIENEIVLDSKGKDGEMNALKLLGKKKKFRKRLEVKI